MKKLFFVLTLALVLLTLAACGNASPAAQNTPSSTEPPQSASPTEEPAPAADPMSEYASAGYIDEHGFLTARALVELDGAELAKVAEAAGYQWMDDDCEWAKKGTYVRPSRAITKEDYASGGEINHDFTADEVALFASGAAGTPVNWFVSNFDIEYENAEQLFADQQVEVVERCEVEHRYYGTEIWAIIENSAGQRFLMVAWRYNSDSSGALNLFTTDYIAKNSRSIASHFNLGDYLLEDAHTIDEIWPVLLSGEVS